MRISFNWNLLGKLHNFTKKPIFLQTTKIHYLENLWILVQFSSFGEIWNISRIFTKCYRFSSFLTFFEPNLHLPDPTFFNENSFKQYIFNSVINWLKIIIHGKAIITWKNRFQFSTPSPMIQGGIIMSTQPKFHRSLTTKINSTNGTCNR